VKLRALGRRGWTRTTTRLSHGTFAGAQFPAVARKGVRPPRAHLRRMLLRHARRVQALPYFRESPSGGAPGTWSYVSFTRPGSSAGFVSQELTLRRRTVLDGRAGLLLLLCVEPASARAADARAEGMTR
jgi:hypothetical protein